MQAKTYQTNFKTAAEWLNGDLIYLHDPKHLLEFYEIEWEDTDNVDEEALVEKEVYQAWLTSYNEDDVNFLHEHFGLRFAYCEDLDLYILLVEHYGTSWDYVYWTTDIENASCGLGENPRAF